MTDVNDNIPVFYPDVYAKNIHRSASVGETLIVVKATDEDSGVNGEVSYQISAGNGGNYFNVDASSG